MSYAEPTQQSAPYEFDNYPLDVVLIRRPNHPKPLELKHRVRKPSIDEWVQWGRDIKRARRIDPGHHLTNSQPERVAK